jgi:hypothetical protein
MFVVLLSLSGGFLLLAVFFAYQASEPSFFKWSGSGFIESKL